MHPIHTTPGFIIDSRPSGEAGKVLSIFTRDLGLVFASAQGIRLEKSKLRYQAQEYCFGIFSFVKGKELWRLTSAQESVLGTRYSELDSIKYQLVARIALLLRRLLHGEDAHPELFECIETCSRFLSENMELSDEELKTVESVVVFRILHALGYIGRDAALDELLKSQDFTVQLVASAVSKRPIINQHINKALKESHL